MFEANGRPAIASSGERVAVSVLQPDRDVSLWSSVDGAVEGRSSGAYPWDGYADESLLLFNRLEGSQRAIGLFERPSGKTTSLLVDPETSSFQGQFSANGRWVAWMDGLGGTVWVVPFRGAQPLPKS